MRCLDTFESSWLVVFAHGHGLAYVWKARVPWHTCQVLHCRHVCLASVPGAGVVVVSRRLAQGEEDSQGVDYTSTAFNFHCMRSRPKSASQHEACHEQGFSLQDWKCCGCHR